MDEATTKAATQTEYRVRVAVPSDLEAIVQLHHRHGKPSDPRDPRRDSPADLQRGTWDRMMATDILTVYVAEAAGHVVGNTCMTVVPNLINDCRSSAFVEPMLVAADHRRGGVGRLMVERLVADARTSGCYKIQLLSHKRHVDDGAHAFYRSLGFDAEAEGFRLYLA